MVKPIVFGYRYIGTILSTIKTQLNLWFFIKPEHSNYDNAQKYNK